MSKLDEEEIYIFNPGYQMRKDKNRIIIFKKSQYDSNTNLVNSVLFIHPLVALLLSSFDGKTKTTKIINDFSNITAIKKSVIKVILENCLLNHEICSLFFDSFRSIIPNNSIVPAHGLTRESIQEVEEFLIPHDELDFKSRRLYVPLDLLFEINFSCVTDCIYCYAHRSKKYRPLTLTRILELIKEAERLGMRSFNINGGEFFLHKDWEKILYAMVASGFQPYISTKVPISKEIMMKLKNIGVDSLQISLDSVIENEMKQILNVDDDYCRDMFKCLDNLAEFGFNININSQMTKFNENSMEELLKYLLNYRSYLKRIRIGAAGFSLYKTTDSFLSFRARLDSVKKAEKIIDQYSKSEIAQGIPISMSYISAPDEILNTIDKKTDEFNKRSNCSGNFSAFVMLPDGKVTVCEELYWHPKFIIGDLSVQSIEEVWNSKRALELYHFSKSEVRKESECYNCPNSDFIACHENSGVCWKEVIKAYGAENWDFPDPRCPRAPYPLQKYWIE